jgi:hypothetical protein
MLIGYADLSLDRLEVMERTRDWEYCVLMGTEVMGT